MPRKPNWCGSVHHHHCAVCHSRTEQLSSAMTFCSQCSPCATLLTVSWACSQGDAYNASFSWDACIRFGVCLVLTSPPTSWQRSCWLDWTTAMLYSSVCRTQPLHRCSAATRPVYEGPRHRRHHPATLATSPCPDTFQAVSVSPRWKAISYRTTSPSCYSLLPQDTQVCCHSITMPCSLHEHHWSSANRLSVLLVPQLGTAFQQTFRQPAALHLSKRNSRLLCFINFMTLQ